MGSSSPSIGDAVGDALYDWTDIGKGWEDLKKNPEEFAEFVMSYLEQRGDEPLNKEKTKQVIIRAVQKSAKVLDKMIPTVESLKHLKATSHAVSGAADDPFQILRNAGIDIEPELEEFRAFLMEISGKKQAPKFNGVQKDAGKELITETSENKIKTEASKLLGMIQGLKLSEGNETTLKNLESLLWERIEKADKDLALAGLYALVMVYLRRGGLDDAEGFLRGFVEGSKEN